MTGTLYLCATPIGNLGDITLRTLETLKNVDLIAAEDTRRTLTLLNHFEIHAPLTSYYEHNKAQKGKVLIDQLLEGKNIALVSDAGMPGISDPGQMLVESCIKHDIRVEALPGASACITALVASGLETSRFAFEGFLSMNRTGRAARLQEVKNDPRTLIFYEAPHKLIATLKDMLNVWGNRRIVLARELTKKHEEYRRTTLQDALEYYETNPPKGEFVLIMEGKNLEELLNEKRQQLPTPEELLQQYANDGFRGRELVKMVAEELSLPKREIYDLHLKLKK